MDLTFGAVMLARRSTALTVSEHPLKRVSLNIESQMEIYRDRFLRSKDHCTLMRS